jgi:hypothetical protein
VVHSCAGLLQLVLVLLLDRSSTRGGRGRCVQGASAAGGMLLRGGAQHWGAAMEGWGQWWGNKGPQHSLSSSLGGSAYDSTPHMWSEGGVWPGHGMSSVGKLAPIGCC